MKSKHIIGFIIMAMSIVVLITMALDFSTYASFEDAAKNPEKSVQIVGYLSKDKPMEYDPEKDPNYFSFYMKDKKGTESKVIYLSAKPQDFERSEEIVLTGKMKEETFVASDMLLKCPSKYVEEEIELKQKTSLNQ